MFKTPFILPLIYPELTWKVKTEEKVIYLTFDDGPIPEVTEFVLDALKTYNAKATFFCIGENVKKHPEVFKKVLNDGHSIGNHTFNHLNGWKTQNETYYENISQCAEILKQQGVETNLLRPPYGRIKKSQAKSLTTDYKVVMWSVLTKDYNPYVPKQTALTQSIRHTSTGSIIVLHDSVKAFPTMKYVLPRYLEHFNSKGFRFERLEMVW